MIFRVVMKVGYYARWFDFTSATDASHFAMLMLNHEVESEDHKDVATEVVMKVINKAKEEAEVEKEEE